MAGYPCHEPRKEVNIDTPQETLEPLPTQSDVAGAERLSFQGQRCQCRRCPEHLQGPAFTKGYTLDRVHGLEFSPSDQDYLNHPMELALDASPGRGEASSTDHQYDPGTIHGLEPLSSAPQIVPRHLPHLLPAASLAQRATSLSEYQYEGRSVTISARHNPT